MVDCVAGRGNKLHRLVERKIALYDLRASGLDDWEYRVSNPRDTRRIILLLLCPMGELAIRHDVFRFGEGRHPAAILEPRVPTHVVDVQMRAHYIVNVINRKPGGSETFLEPITAHHVPERPRRPRLVIANTGINQDIVVQRLYDEALHA
jgi:hypothetical protein